MPGKSNRSQMVSFRLSNEAIDKIKIALMHPANGNTSVGDYCKQVIERHAFRHDKRKFRRQIEM